MNIDEVLTRNKLVEALTFYNELFVKVLQRTPDNKELIDSFTTYNLAISEGIEYLHFLVKQREERNRYTVGLELEVMKHHKHNTELIDENNKIKTILNGND